MDEIKRIARANYLSLATLRRDGRQVATPVWFVVADSVIWIFSGAQAGKVKRIRNNPKVTVAVCNFRGRVEGRVFNGRATLLDETHGPRIEKLLNRKYWYVKPLLNGISAISRLAARQSTARRAYIEVRLDTSELDPALGLANRTI